MEKSAEGDDENEAEQCKTVGRERMSQPGREVPTMLLPENYFHRVEFRGLTDLTFLRTHRDLCFASKCLHECDHILVRARSGQANAPMDEG